VSRAPVRIRERAQAVAYAVGASAVKALPEALMRPLFRAGADVAWRRRGRGVQQLERNLRRVEPAIADAEFALLVRDAMRSYARYWLEFFRLPVLGEERILGRTRIEGEQVLAAALARGRGAIIALPHSGNWDHAGAWLVLRGFPFTTVAERLRPESLFDRFVAVRERLGMEVLPLTGGERDTYAALMRRLRAGRTLCLVAERDIGDTGVEVSFFGAPARMPTGPAALALATGAALLPAVLWFSDDEGPGGGWRGRIYDELVPPTEGDKRAKVGALTQRLAAVFEAGIAEHPRDWHMLQPLWAADRTPRPARATPASAALERSS
jgi:KDO2-lipid IV(A) lauroyltransferase